MPIKSSIRNSLKYKCSNISYFQTKSTMQKIYSHCPIITLYLFLSTIILNAQVDINAAKGITIGNGTQAARDHSIRIWHDSLNGFDIDVNSSGQLQMYPNGFSPSITFDDGAEQNVGIGTTNPMAKLHILGGADVGGASGGSLVIGTLNGSNMGFDENEITAKSNGEPSTLFLNIQNVTGGNIAAGDGLIRTNYTFHHDSGSPSSNGSGFTIENNESGSKYWTLYSQNSTGDMQLFANNSLVGSFNAGTGAYTALSDERLKRNIKPFEIDLEILKRLEPKVYHFRKNSRDRASIGFIAQEVAKIIPALVYTSYVGDTDEKIHMLNYSDFGVVAIAAIKQIQEENERENKMLNEQLSHQQVQIDELRSLVDTIISEKQSLTLKATYK